jgi:putative transposase
LLSGLPGRTFRSWERRADHNPDDGPFISYDALLEIIHLHMVDVYAQSRHPMAPHTRLEMWQASAAEFPPALSGSVEDLVPLLAKTAERSLSVRGIELSGMFYSSDALMALRSTMAAHNLAMDKLSLRYNPWDLGTIWVLDPVERHFIEAPAVDVAMRGLTEYQWRVMRRALRERFDQPDHVLSLAAARNRIRDTVEQSIKKPSRKRRARAARYSSLFQSTGRLETPQTPAHESPVPNTVSASESAELTRNSRAPANAGSPINVDDWDVDY